MDEYSFATVVSGLIVLLMVGIGGHPLAVGLGLVTAGLIMLIFHS